MASNYLISIILKAVTGDARRELKAAARDIRDFGGAAGAQPFDDLIKRSKDLEARTHDLGEEARELREEMEANEEALFGWSGAANAAAEAAVFLGAGFAALKLGEKAVDIARTAAAGVALGDSFDSLAARAQIDSELLLSALDEASKGTISDYDLMREANEAWHSGVAKNIGQYSDLMKIAEEKSKDLGMSTLEYWDSLSSALATGYPAALRQLGAVIDLDSAYESYAHSIDKTADELSEQERIQARVVAVIRGGEPALRDWEQAELDAITVTQQFDAATADLTATIKEGLLPVLLPAMQWMTDAMHGIEAGAEGQNQVIGELIKTTGSAAAAEEEFARRLEIASQGMIDGAEAARQAHIAMLDYRLDLIGIDKGIQEDIRAMRMAQNATYDLSIAHEDLAEETEDAADAADKAHDIWHDYLTDIAEEGWQFAHRMEEVAFRQIQAAEDAAFRLYEIERDSGQRRDDLLDKFWMDEEADQRRHQMRMLWARQDYLDELSDMEWEHQQEKRDMLDRAPWWIKQALGKEFRERERIVKSGDKDALREFDKKLMAQIRAIDPAYAKMLDQLQERYKHEKKIEQRERQQEKRRQEAEFREDQRLDQQRLDLSLRDLQTGLGRELQAWSFHDQQRLENERWAMDNLNIEYGHALDRMKSETDYRLSELPPLYKHYGYDSWTQWLRGWTDAQHDWPMPVLSGGYTPAPTTPPDWSNPFGPGGIYGAGPSTGGDGVTVNIETMVLGNGVTPLDAQRIGEELGHGIRRGYR